jgi:hypothetical protein
MLHAARWMLAVVPLLLASGFLAVQGAQGDEMVANPFYKYWANCKPGSTVTLLEKTALTGPDKALFPGGIDEKLVSCKLLTVKPEHVVVEFVVKEHEFVSLIESAPTKKTYPAKVKKADLVALLHGVEPKMGEETIDVLGKKLACVTMSGTMKKDGTDAEHMLWLSDKVPGGIVKHTRVTKQDGKLVADTKIVVTAFKNAD